MFTPMHKKTDMISDIENEVRYTSRLIGKDRLDKNVMQAMRSVPRDQFVSSESVDIAYENCPLSIGHGQTISQPFIVALMTDLLQLDENDRVLEIGTGSGYQSAVLSELCREVYTVEYIPLLAEVARERLKRLHYDNIHCLTGNGYDGWPEYAPYDAIIVTAAASHIPPALQAQLKPGGRMVIPLGRPYAHQDLNLIVKDNDGKVDVHSILGVAFVPMQGEAVSV